MLHADGDAVVSCHAERISDDAVWNRLHELLREAPGGFSIVPLLRPPHAEEERGPWLERALAAAELGPVGHHTHFARPEHARPIVAEDIARVRREAEWLSEHGLRPQLFCGGGWYMDADVAEAAADYGYVDCTALAFCPPQLVPDRRHLYVDVPGRLRLPTGRRLLELPTTHTIGMILRALPRQGLDSPLVHVYFHDTELVDPRRRAGIRWALRLLARSRIPIDLRSAARAAEAGPEIPFETALRD